MARRSVRALVLLSVALGPLTGALSAPAEPDGLDCPDLAYVPLVGPACPVDGGWLVQFSDGQIAFTHGPDTAPATPARDDPVAEPVPPDCVDASAEYYHHVVYVRLPDAPDRYAEIAPELRRLVAEANGLLQEEARRFGYRMAFPFLCEGGEVVVGNETGPVDFSPLRDALVAAGYDDPRAKYWVWHNETLWPYGGLAMLFKDDSPGVENQNNGNAGQPMFGVTYGHLSSWIMLHEGGHTLGAVQPWSPNNQDSTSVHCSDGLDIVCYGPSWGDPDPCKYRRRFDCHNDDYFHPDPPTGSYLATHWNLGSDVHRYVTKAFVTNRPVAALAEACDGLSCTFDASDSTDPDGDALTYFWEFGDGTNATGAVVDHTYPKSEWWTVRLTVLDAFGAESTIKRSVLASVDHEPPTTNITVGSQPSATGWYASWVRLDLASTDDDAGVAAIRWRMVGEDWRPYVPPLLIPYEGDREYQASAIDRVGNEEDPPASVRLAIDLSGPVVRIVHPNGGVYLDGRPLVAVPTYHGRATLLFTDEAEGVVRVEVNATDRYSGLRDVVVYARTDEVVEVCRAERVAGDLWACEWPRSAVEDDKFTLEVRAWDNVLHQGYHAVRVEG